MKYLLLTFCLILASLPAFSQQVQLFGKVTNTKGNPLPGATIKYQTKLGTISDLKGVFFIEIKTETSVKLTIRYIGFETVDTTINTGKEPTLFLDIKMKLKLKQLPNIEITATYQNIFENYKHHILDFTILNEIIYLIIQKGRKFSLSKANIKGTILKEYDLKGGYKRFYNSCLGNIILVGNESCAELHDIDGNVLITNQFDIDYFDKYIIPCKLQIDGTLIFKGITRHNKKIDYFRYFNDHNPHILYTVHDKVGEEVSKYYFSSLISLYYRHSENAGTNDIDYGFERDNLIDDGVWEGDIQDLIISNLTHKYAIQYQALGLKTVESDLFVIDNKVYILDQLNKQIVQVNDDLRTIFKVDDFDQKGKVKIISDFKDESYFLIDNMIYAIDIDTNEFKITPHKSVAQSFFTQRKLLYKNTLYRLGRKSINNTQKTIFRDVLE